MSRQIRTPAFDQAPLKQSAMGHFIMLPIQNVQPTPPAHTAWTRRPALWELLSWAVCLTQWEASPRPTHPWHRQDLYPAAQQRPHPDVSVYVVVFGAWCGGKQCLCVLCRQKRGSEMHTFPLFTVLKTDHKN